MHSGTKNYRIFSPNFLPSPNPSGKDRLLGQTETTHPPPPSVVHLRVAALNQYKSNVCSITNMKWVDNALHLSSYILRCGYPFLDYYLFW